MNQPSSKLCPKCGKPYKEIRKFNSNYDIYIHKQRSMSLGLHDLIKYCIVTVSHVYNTPEVIADGLPLNPGYRRPKP